MSVTIIVPTYNEAENIPELVRRIKQAVDGVRILVMDDSPNSYTADAAWKAGCEVIQRTKDRGLSKAVIDGLSYTASDKIIVMDADLQHPPELLPEIIKALDTHDFVVASRYIKGGGCEEWEFDRKVISRIANLATRPLTSVKDAVSGFFGFRKSGLPRLSTLNDRGFKIMLELLVKGNWDSITEVPFIFSPRLRGQTKMRFEQVRDYALQLGSLYRYKFKRLLKFMIVGAGGTVVSLGLLYLLTSVVGWHYLMSFPIVFVFSVSNNYTWNSLWTFRDRKASAAGLGRYVLISLLALGIYEGLMLVFTDLLGLWYMLSAVLVIAIAFLINFTLSKKFVWRALR